MLSARLSAQASLRICAQDFLEILQFQILSRGGHRRGVDPVTTQKTQEPPMSTTAFIRASDLASNPVTRVPRALP